MICKCVAKHLKIRWKLLIECLNILLWNIFEIILEIFITPFILPRKFHRFLNPNVLQKKGPLGGEVLIMQYVTVRKLTNSERQKFNSCTIHSSCLLIVLSRNVVLCEYMTKCCLYWIKGNLPTPESYRLPMFIIFANICLCKKSDKLSKCWLWLVKVPQASTEP